VTLFGHAKITSMHAEELWTGNSLKARILRFTLTPASWLYAAGWQSYLGAYRLGIKKAKEPHVPVICVGNLLVGGTGKTPVTVHLADVLADLGHKVVISCSGYGSPASEAARVTPGGQLNAAEWGDEAAMIRTLRPEIPLIVGRRRVLAGRLCHEHFADHVLLMDDGFQHLPVKKHLSIVLDPPQKNRRCLPAGPYREPAGNVSRADLVLPAEFSLAARPLEFVEAGDFGSLAGHKRSIDRGTVLCALGRPRSFLEALSSTGFVAEEVLLMPDHDPLTEGNLLSRLGSGVPIVVTGKDWVKLRERPDVVKYEIVIASHSVTIEPRDAFRDWLQAKLNGIRKKED
jgi:tetraacyldisaccharide 4'-kinase